VPDLVVAGAGMAGLAAAVEALERGAEVTLLEKGPAAGGSMRLSSGVVWRHRDFEQFRRECPDGDPVLQRLVFDRLDGDIRWLERHGARVVRPATGNPATVGVRFSTDSLVRALGGRVKDIRLRRPLTELPDDVPVVLATGGFQADRELVRRHITAEADSLLLRATPWSTGDGLRLAVGAGAATTGAMDEFYGRNMPAPPARVRETGFVELAQLYARHATVESATGERYEPRTWSEIDVVQWTARQPGARAYYRVAREQLSARIRDRTVGDMVDAAEHAGAEVRRTGAGVTVQVVAGITTTLGGLAVDASARAAPGVYAAGSDVGGIASGGYSSGLAAALVLGRIAGAAAVEAR
jgi:succinate dehydrogenase/fumarate reductase flavoprotein subunit